MSTLTIPSQNSQSIWAYLQLMRPANITTAWADILMGCAAAGISLSNPDFATVFWLLLSTTGLYGGGVVFNDVCDAELDALERPERPIPSNRASLVGAFSFSTILLAIGIFAASMVSTLSTILAIAIATMALVYDKWGKHHGWLGPLNMGTCRGFNLLLGMSAIPFAVSDHWYLALIPLIYIGAITAISQGEVHGGKKSTGVVAITLIGLVIGCIIGLAALVEYSLVVTLPFLALFTILVTPPFFRAAMNPNPELIQLAVKAGIISLIVLDATIAAGFSNWIYGLSILGLLPLSRFLGKQFAIT